ncbi:hypothetical protein [Oryza sativa Japonica Group]|uniref:Uncharacterized protein n=1 Tax=Oryza sativa subsp. japonica TaxID=39947 RepID=Q8L445_ORYSJ|nr:hypothetical protein [Oryza sativa Japonica Group]BAC00589.1 hypothetical protein [Oryza sativa Japonica Group]
MRGGPLMVTVQYGGFGGGGGTNKAAVTRTGDGEARRRRDVGMKYQAAATVGRHEGEARAPRTVARTTGGHKGEARRGQRDAGEAHARPTIVGTAPRNSAAGGK